VRVRKRGRLIHPAAAGTGGEVAAAGAPEAQSSGAGAKPL
jgi:hypothetical protein